MDKHELTLRRMLMERPPRDWPLLAKAMAWQRGSDGPPWMTPQDREWFWATLDFETAEAEKRAPRDAEWASIVADWERAKVGLLAPFVRFVEWLARKLA